MSDDFDLIRDMQEDREARARFEWKDGYFTGLITGLGIAIVACIATAVLAVVVG